MSTRNKQPNSRRRSITVSSPASSCCTGVNVCHSHSHSYSQRNCCYSTRRRLLFVGLVLAFTIIFCSAELTSAQQQQQQDKLNLDPRNPTRERIQENHQRRRGQLMKLLEETRQKVDDHESNRKLLADEEEYNLMKKRIGLYEKKVHSAHDDDGGGEGRMGGWMLFGRKSLGSFICSPSPFLMPFIHFIFFLSLPFWSTFLGSLYVLFWCTAINTDNVMLCDNVSCVYMCRHATSLQNKNNNKPQRRRRCYIYCSWRRWKVH